MSVPELKEGEVLSVELNVSASSADAMVAALINTAIDGIRQLKPNDRSPKDRRFAVVLTELEKVSAYAQVYIVGDVILKIDEGADIPSVDPKVTLH
jgi:hypothetical protein